MQHFDVTKHHQKKKHKTMTKMENGKKRKEKKSKQTHK